MNRGIQVASVLAAMAAIVLSASPAHAQLGSLKKKVKQQLEGKPKTATPATAAPAAAPAAPSGGQAVVLSESFYTPANRVDITPAVVDRFLTGLRAEIAERDRIAASKSGDINVIRFWRRHDRRVYCDSLMKSLDAQSAAAEKTLQSGPTGSQMNSAVQTIQRVAAEKNKGCDAGTEPEMVQTFFENLRTAESGMDQTGATAAGFSRGQYAYLRERIAALALGESKSSAKAGYSNGKNVGYTGGELAAVRARASVIVPLLLRDFVSSGERAPSSVY